MIRELGFLMELVVPEDATDGNWGYSRFSSVEFRCDRCRTVLPGWYPKPPPEISLILHDEELTISGLGVLVLHEALFEILHEYAWPNALSTRCVTHEESKLDIGDQYLAVTLPPLHLTPLLTTKSEDPKNRPWQCVRCKRYRYPGGRQDEGSVPYVALDVTQLNEAAFAATSWPHVLVTAPLRKMIDKLRIGSYGWQTVAIYSERLPHHVVPDEVM